MNEEKFCLFCGDQIDTDTHGNRAYCNDDCYKNQKLFRNNKKYADQKKANEAFKKADEILSMFHKTYGSEKYIPVDLPDHAGMDWCIVRKVMEIDNLPVTTIGNYGYCLFNNETLRIWNLTNQ